MSLNAVTVLKALENDVIVREPADRETLRAESLPNGTFGRGESRERRILIAGPRRVPYGGTAAICEEVHRCRVTESRAPAAGSASESPEKEPGRREAEA